MKRLARIIALLTFASPIAFAQPQDKVFRIGLLANTIPMSELANTIPMSELANKTSSNPLPKRIEDGLRDLGWIDGKNVQLIWRSAEGDLSRLPELARELVALRVEVIVAAGHGVVPAMEATRSIPIVMVASSFLREGGLRSPQRNVTGLTLTASSELMGKRMALLKEVAPRIRRVAIVGDTPWQIDAETQRAARRLGLIAIASDFDRNPDTIPDMIARAVGDDGVDAMIIDEGLLLHTREVQTTFHTFAVKHRLPMLHANLTATQTGGLLAYGPDVADLQRRSVFFIDRILRGAKPEDLPIEHPTRFELTLNLTAARALGLTVPQTILLQADRVIE